MTTLKHLLSDKFVEFSAEIRDVHNEIKSVTAAFKAEIKVLQEKADSLRADFETWEKDQDAFSPKTAKTEAAEKVDTTLPNFGGHPFPAKDDKVKLPK
jgi:hypothetical protein